MFNEFNPLQQHVVQVLAVAATPVSLSVLIQMLKECGWADANTQSGFLTQKLLKPELKKLSQVHYVALSDSAMNRVELESKVIDAMVQQSVINGNFDRIVKVVDSCKKILDADAAKSPKGSVLAIAQRVVRIAFYRGDVTQFNAVIQDLRARGREIEHLGLLDPFNKEIFERTPAELQAYMLVESVSLALLQRPMSPKVVSAFGRYMKRETSITEATRACWVHLLASSGELKQLQELADSETSANRLAAAYLTFLTGDFEKSETLFSELSADKQQKSGSNAEDPSWSFPMPIVYLLLLLRKNDPASRKKLAAYLKSSATTWPPYLKRLPTVASAALAYRDKPSKETKAYFKLEMRNVKYNSLDLVKAIAIHISHWFLPNEDILADLSKQLSPTGKQFSRLGFNWYAAICEDALRLMRPSDDTLPVLGERHRQLGTFALPELIEPEAVWKRKLETLRELVQGQKPKAGKAASSSTGFDERMIWELNVNNRDHQHPFLRPIIQKLSGKGWTKGRPIALERLSENHKTAAFAFLSDQDQAVIRTIDSSEVSTGYYRYTETVYDFDREAALEALVGHPFVFAPGNRDQSLELVLRSPQLVLRKTRDHLRLELSPKPHGENPLVITTEGKHRVVIVRFTVQQLRIAGILEGAIECPKKSQSEVLATAKALSSLLSVESDIEMELDESDVSATAIEAEPRPHLHLVPFHEGVRAEFFVQPFGDAGPSFVPGQGGRNVFATLQNQSLSTRRDFKRELSLVHDIINACPSLAAVADENLLAFDFPDAVDTLELLTELEPLRDLGTIVLHWPQGESFRIAAKVDSPSQLRVRIAKDKDWFAASGEVVVDELLKMDFLQLVNLVSASQSRFVALDDGRFLALTQSLRERISEMATYSDRSSKSLRFPSIRAAALLDVDQWCSLKADKHWKACVKRIEQAGDVTAEVPSTLAVELRDYQIEGFRWLCRLAHWGAGACLADDMGLGKTLQAIALLLRRGAEGPALVIAPMSVCFNWEAELHRFAPTLNARIFGSGDREAFFADLGPRDVAIASYGLLNSEVERLQAVTWHTIILDEAQAIKNTMTQRSQAAMSLSGDFRLILTGTPIENHLGELWNLFQFINPGLLGSLQDYHQQFALPIERDHNREASQQLKRLVQPFLLRRTKTQVLKELPARIEVTMPVTLGDEEAALYEAARLRAVEALADKTEKKGQHLKILAEIMRLRRTCCHPSLLMPDCDLPGAKLTAFTETIDELIENKHKALVFSQFVDHLSILRKELDRKGIFYQYLDGSTSAKQRKASVEAFQNGEGDVFLISLKAGGTGLNLTAADYVLHMDPWWNPAVEDQAADRAHRMGQLRPVTIYRFITRGTIEEKILELHGTKRELADNLLAGSETTGRLSAEELLALIR